MLVRGVLLLFCRAQPHSTEHSMPPYPLYHPIVSKYPSLAMPMCDRIQGRYDRGDGVNASGHGRIILNYVILEPRSWELYIYIKHTHTHTQTYRTLWGSRLKIAGKLCLSSP